VIYLLFVPVLLPALFFAITLTVYLPALAKVCFIVLAVVVTAFVLSPKFQVHESGAPPVPVYVKVTARGCLPDTLSALNAAQGLATVDELDVDAS
jgi:hypothetical protein